MLRGGEGVRKMLRSAKTYTYIWSIGLSYDMLNLEDHFPYFMAMTNFGSKLPYWPQVVPAASKWVEHCWLNIVFHIWGVHLGPQDVLKNSYIWLFQVKKLHFWILLGHPWDISGGAKRTQRTPHDVRYNVQPCST